MTLPESICNTRLIKMISIKFATILFALSMSLCLCDRQINEYLRFSQKATSHLQELSWIQEKVAGLGEAEPQVVADFIKKAAEISDDLIRGRPVVDDDTGVTNYEKGRMYRLHDALMQFYELITIGDQLVCSEYVLQYYTDLIKLSFGNLDSFIKMLSSNTQPDHDVTLFNFLKHYGLEQYTFCLGNIEKKFTKVRHTIDKSAEELFDSILLLGQDENDVWLANKAENLNFVNGTFNARRMFAEIEKRYEFEPSELSTADRFINFMTTLCLRLRSTSSGLFDLYNFVKAINPEETSKLKMPPRFRKLNEYSRLCLELQVEEVGQLARGNIRKNMNNVWFRKVLKLIE